MGQYGMRPLVVDDTNSKAGKRVSDTLRDGTRWLLLKSWPFTSLMPYLEWHEPRETRLVLPHLSTFVRPVEPRQGHPPEPSGAQAECV